MTEKNSKSGKAFVIFIFVIACITISFLLYNYNPDESSEQTFHEDSLLVKGGFESASIDMEKYDVPYISLQVKSIDTDSFSFNSATSKKIISFTWQVANESFERLADIGTFIPISYTERGCGDWICFSEFSPYDFQIRVKTIDFYRQYNETNYYIEVLN